MAGENGNDQEAPANMWKVVLGRIFTRDRVSFLKKFRWGMGYISVAAVASLVSIALAYLFLRPKPDGSGGPVATFMDWLKETFLSASSEDVEAPDIDIIAFLKNIPTEPVFYYSIAALLSIYLGRYLWLYAKLRKEFETKKEKEDKYTLTPRDWWVAQGFRERSVTLRLQAGLFLGCIFALLFMGVYFIIFVLPAIEEQDQNFFAEQYKREIGDKLDLLAEGRYWLRIPENLSKDDGQNFIHVNTSDNQIGVDIFPQFVTLNTENGGGDWNRLDLSLAQGESAATAAAFSADGETGMVAGNNGLIIFLTRNNGENWNRLDLSLAHGEWATAAAFSADGKTGMVAGNNGSIFLTRNNEENWNRLDLSLAHGESATAAAFSADGKTGMVAGNGGSIFLTRNNGKNWNRLDLSLAYGEWAIEAAFSADGETGMVAGNKDSVFLTRNNGRNWNRLGLPLNRGERVAAAAFSADGKTGMVAGNDGSVFLTRNSGENWNRLGLPLNRGERVTKAVFSANGKAGVIAGDESSILLTRDGGENWDRSSLSLERGERVTEMVFTAFSDDNNIGVIQCVTTSVFLTRDGGKNWDRLTLSLERRERITEDVFSANGKAGVVAGNKGSVFLTRDGGKNWDRLNLPLSAWSGGPLFREWIIAAALSADDETGVVVSNRGSTFLIRTGIIGDYSWQSTEGEHVNSSETFRSVMLTTDGSYVAETENRTLYLLRSYPEFNKWPEMSLMDIHRDMDKYTIFKNSDIYKNISVELYKNTNTKDVDNKQLFGVLYRLTVMRTVTLVALFFLVHVLVRLHQYNLRLAAFWDARADAVLLARSFASRRTETFDDLVAVLAPDAYDFKPTSKSGQEAVMNLMGQFLRRESRKS